MRRVVITGGTGLIGRALAAELLAAGYEVVALSRNPQRAHGLSTGVRVEAWDGRTAQGWGGLADGAYAIINLAGENIAGGPWTAERKHRIRQSRLDAGQAVVEAVRAAGQKPAVVVQASGIGYYGPRGDEEVAEDFPPGSDFLGRLAVEWEASTAPVEALGVRRVVIRTGVVLSREGGALPRLALPFRFFLGGPLGGGRQWVPWIHIADEVRAIRFLLEHEASQGPYNLAAPYPVANRELARALGQVLRRSAWLPVPAPALWLLLGEMSTVLLSGQRAIPKRLLEEGFVFQFPEAGPALRNLFEKETEMAWIDILDENRLPEGGREVVEVDGTPVLLIRHRGEVFAVAARCPHMGAPLKNGRVTEEGYLVCPWHRSAFSLRTGDVAQWTPWPPGVGKVMGALRRERALPVYPVRVANGRILVRIGAD